MSRSGKTAVVAAPLALEREQVSVLLPPGCGLEYLVPVQDTGAGGGSSSGSGTSSKTLFGVVYKDSGSGMYGAGVWTGYMFKAFGQYPTEESAAQTARSAGGLSWACLLYVLLVAGSSFVSWQLRLIACTGKVPLDRSADVLPPVLVCHAVLTRMSVVQFHSLTTGGLYKKHFLKLALLSLLLQASCCRRTVTCVSAGVWPISRAWA
jgi:hypothetical protein